MKTTPRFPLLRALVRALTSPRRVWFWTTTLPVLLAPVLLYWVMRPGVGFHRSVKVGAVEVDVVRTDVVGPDDSSEIRFGRCTVAWPEGGARASCWAVEDWAPSYFHKPGSAHLGPLVWCFDAHSEELGFETRWFGLSVHVYH